MPRSKILPRYTYDDTYGIVYKNFDTHDLAHLCIDIEMEFGDGYLLRPDPICEGGIVFNGYPDKKDQYGYKSFRLTGFTNTRYPWIYNSKNSIEYLLSIKPVVLGSPVFTKKKTIKKEKVRFVLKAFRGAPVWTYEDLQKFKKCFFKYGIDLRVEKRKYYSLHPHTVYRYCLCCPIQPWNHLQQKEYTVSYQVKHISNHITEIISKENQIPLINDLILSYSFVNGYMCDMIK